MHIFIGRVPSSDFRNCSFNDPCRNEIVFEKAVVDGEMYWSERWRFGYPNCSLKCLWEAFRLVYRPACFHERGCDGGWPEGMAKVQRYAIGEATGVTGKRDHNDGKVGRPNIYELAQSLCEAGS